MNSKYLIYLFLILSSSSCFSQKQNEGKILVDIGDSLTAGAGGKGTSMSSVTSKLLGSEWTVINMGVGGENTLTIGARYGAIPMYIKESIIIPKDGSKVKIPTGLYSSYNDSNVLPLKQGNAGINPCYIDSIACELSLEKGTYFINRIEKASKDYVTIPKSKIITSLSNKAHGIATIFIGQNGSYESPEDLLNQIDLFVEHKGDNNVIIITSHGNGVEKNVRPIREKYGSRLIDLKKYMSTQAIYDAIAFDLLPKDVAHPTEQDLEMMKKERTPPSLLIDGIHFNSIGYELLGRLRFKKGKELGYW
ncbi:GDSL-like Lipase/Acylhydrolase [Nonlabens dokdonensis]|uniref:Uncharacterized protein n=2 Tax=Nonlabens dokdonensis TaxID=328515 RepID=L7W4N5_NONDD|nr:hypothetical protein [Nonlabens dokdonensis]AGC76580.1 hypothetical protein DDD_1453 [Nonlabens dokdonensis DSW-6]PZX44231.1 GDSL-like Lipase/Acylhydrolase [Nonlabens dokdonensis]